jgi:manganese-dependent inorganic pyrophosphatase
MEKEETVVIGHINPDMDSIASAIGYAWLKNQTDLGKTSAARAGGINPQTAWVLAFFGIEPPELITDSSPRIESVSQQLQTLSPDKPLREAWTIANQNGGIVPLVKDDGTPIGLITGWSIFAHMSSEVGPHLIREQDQITSLFDQPCLNAANKNVPSFKKQTKINEVLKRVLHEEKNDFFVVDKSGKYFGVCRQKDLLNPPRMKLILVDHNEPKQAINALDECVLVEVLDHHRLNIPSTHQPIKVTVDIVGSTSTLVAEKILESNLTPPPEISGLLLAGLISDTLILTSPTTTERDRKIVDKLSDWTFLKEGRFETENFKSFANQIIQAGANLTTRTPADIISTDMKLYEGNGIKFTISQAEVTRFQEVDGMRSSLSEALVDHQEKSGTDFAMLMITNVMQGNSQIFFTPRQNWMELLPYSQMQNGNLRAPSVVSRKKQLLPVILGILDRN